MTAISRRTALAGVASLAVPASAAAVCAAPGFGGADADPIFAVIDGHRAALIRKLTASERRASTVDLDTAPEYDRAIVEAADEAESICAKAHKEAVSVLLRTQPTTLAGVVALISHIEQVNAGAFTATGVPDFYSSPIEWPYLDERGDGIDTAPFEMLSQVKRTLEVLAVRA